MLQIMSSHGSLKADTTLTNRPTSQPIDDLDTCTMNKEAKRGKREREHLPGLVLVFTFRGGASAAATAVTVAKPAAAREREGEREALLLVSELLYRSLNVAPYREIEPVAMATNAVEIEIDSSHRQFSGISNSEEMSNTVNVIDVPHSWQPRCCHASSFMLNWLLLFHCIPTSGRFLSSMPNSSEA